MRPLLLSIALTGCAHTDHREDLDTVEVLTLRRHYNNAHVVRTERGDLLVDAGLEEDAPALAAAMREAGVDPAGLSLVVVTHGHTDHAGGATWFREQWGIPILAGAGDHDLLAEGRNRDLCPTDAIARQRLDAAMAESYAPFRADHEVPANGTTSLEPWGLPGTVHAVPGHTEGSVVVTIGRAVLVGDLIRGAIAGSGARTHFYQCDLEANRSDVARVLDELAPVDATIFPGHFGPLTREAVQAWLSTHR